MKQSMPVPASCTLPQKNEGCIETLIQLKITLATTPVARVIFSCMSVSIHPSFF